MTLQCISTKVFSSRYIAKEKKYTLRTYSCLCCHKNFNTKSHNKPFCSIECDEYYNRVFVQKPTNNIYNSDSHSLETIITDLSYGYH